MPCLYAFCRTVEPEYMCAHAILEALDFFKNCMHALKFFLRDLGSSAKISATRLTCYTVPAGHRIFVTDTYAI